jgi:hypothetical protein
MTKTERALRYLRRNPDASVYEAAKYAKCSPVIIYQKLNASDPMSRKKIAAHRMVSWAVKIGALKREPCFICGQEKTQGHHVDYDEPLSVVWLCIPHHYETHGPRYKRGQKIGKEMPG